MKLLRQAILMVFTLMVAGMAGELKPGATAKDFTLKDYNGKPHTLSQLAKGKKAVVVIFVSTRCPVSNAYNGRMARLYQSYSGKGVAFVGINSNHRETPADIKAHARKNGLAFPILKDEGNVVADQFGAAVTPEVFVLSPSLKLLYHGRIDDSQREANVKRRDLQKALDEILAGKPVSDPISKEFGCSIRRAN